MFPRLASKTLSFDPVIIVVLPVDLPMFSFSDVAISLRKNISTEFVVRHGSESLVGGVEGRRLSFLSFPLPRIVLDLGTRSLVGGVVL